MKTQTLEFVVEGISVGTIIIGEPDDKERVVSVNGGKILSNGKYGMTPKEIEEMARKKISRDYQGKEIEIKNY